MDEESEESNSPEKDIPQKVAAKRSSSERHEYESSSSEMKRSKFELSGSSSTQAGSVEMDTSHFVQPPLLLFGSTQAAAAGGMELSSAEKNGNTPPFLMHCYREGEPLFQFPPESSAKCARCENEIRSRAGIVCPTNMQHIYCLACTTSHLQEGLPATCPSGQICVGRNSAEPWLIDQSLGEFITTLHKNTILQNNAFS